MLQQNILFDHKCLKYSSLSLHKMLTNSITKIPLESYTDMTHNKKVHRKSLVKTTHELCVVSTEMQDQSRKSPIVSRYPKQQEYLHTTDLVS